MQFSFSILEYQLHFGCPNQNSKTTFNTNTPPKTPHLDTLGTILDPRKVIFDHFIYFGHFPIEILIEAKKSTDMGRKGRRAKTKTVLKTLRQVAKHGSMQNWIS